MKEIIDTLKKSEEKIINKLSLQKEEDKKITLEEVNILLKIAKMLNLAINSLEKILNK